MCQIFRVEPSNWCREYYDYVYSANVLGKIKQIFGF